MMLLVGDSTFLFKFQDDMEYRSNPLPGDQVSNDIVHIGEPTTNRALEALSWILCAKGSD
jgi:hypothetical protein